MKKLNLIKKTRCCSDDIDINEEDIDISFFAGIDTGKLRDGSYDNIAIRGSNEFCEKALWLDERYDYILGTDSVGQIILVPLKKK